MKRWLALSLVGAVALGAVAFLASKPRKADRAKLSPPAGYPLPELAARDYANLVQVFEGRAEAFTTAADANYQAMRYGTGKQAGHTTWNVYDRLLAYQKELNEGFKRRLQTNPRELYFDIGGKYTGCGAGPGIPIYRSGTNLVAVDAWGYLYCGVSTSPFGVVTNAAQVVLPYIPGIGTAASATLQAAIALGQGKSLKDAALAAVRGALPANAQLVFDLGVAVASGQDVDAAVKKALLNQVPNGQATYDLAVQTAKKAGIK